MMTITFAPSLKTITFAPPLMTTTFAPSPDDPYLSSSDYHHLRPLP